MEGTLISSNSGEINMMMLTVFISFVACLLISLPTSGNITVNNQSINKVVHVLFDIVYRCFFLCFLSFFKRIDTLNTNYLVKKTSTLKLLTMSSFHFFL